MLSWGKLEEGCTLLSLWWFQNKSCKKHTELKRQDVPGPKQAAAARGPQAPPCRTPSRSHLTSPSEGWCPAFISFSLLFLWSQRQCPPLWDVFPYLQPHRHFLTHQFTSFSARIGIRNLLPVFFPHWRCRRDREGPQWHMDHCFPSTTAQPDYEHVRNNFWIN